MCYIDGDHSYQAAQNDFHNSDLYLEKAGFVIFDDSADGSEWEGVRRVAQEVNSGRHYRFVEKNPNYMFQKA